MSIKEDNILTKAINTKISRRSFIKWSGALGATASMSGLVMQAGSKAALAADPNAPAAGAGGAVDHWRPTCCLVCHSWCSIAVGLDSNNHVRKIEGAGGQPMNYIGTTEPIKPIDWVSPYGEVKNHCTKADDANHIPTPAGYLPYGPHNKGRICAKGNDGMEHLYNPDRVKYPLKRMPGSKRGEGKWTRVSWNVALTEIANKLRTMAQAGHQHRFVSWIGRDENGVPKDFAKAYGTPNHIEHTSLCELSRHVAGRSLWGHHWSSVDMQEHANVGIRTDAWDYVSNSSFLHYTPLFTLDRAKHDIDCYIEWGGNPAEAKIPHSSCANHLGDRRRSNLVGYHNGTSTHYGRIINIDVRQSNTGAFADENIEIVPGTDGALALGIFYGVLDGGATLVRRDLDRGHNGTSNGKTDTDGGSYDADTRRYYGIFAAEETGGVASGTLWPVPLGQSLESYLFDLNRGSEDSFYDHIGATTTAWLGADGVRDRVSAITNVDVDTLDHLVALLDDGNGGVFRNVVIDGYRGPAKHTNGVYNYRAIRALQYIAPNYSAGEYDFGGATGQRTSGYAGTVRRGGYNAPGAFQSDKNWDPYRSDTGTQGVPSAGGANTNAPGVTSAIASSLPANTAVGGEEAAPSNKMRIDQWDYDPAYDCERWRGSYKWVDQNLAAGIRHSLEMHAFNKGAGYDSTVDGPYSTFDPTFRVEALLIHKNAPSYSRPDQDLEIEMLTKTDPTTASGYKLDAFWAIDIQIGDGSRFADIVLPEATYLERITKRSGEGQEFNYRDNVFWRVPVYEVEAAYNGTTVPRHMYESRQVRAIYYELARTIEDTSTGHTAGGIQPWGGTLYNSFKYVAADLGSKTANAAASGNACNDGEWAAREHMRNATNGVTTIANLHKAAQSPGVVTVGGGTYTGYDLIRSHGMIWSPLDTPAYWRRRFDGVEDGSPKVPLECRARSAPTYGSASYEPYKGYKPYAPAGGGSTTMNYLGNHFTVYNPVLAEVPDCTDSRPTVHTRANGKFYGQPVYIPVTLTTNVIYPRHLTTYKLNVHTQSRTACMPRLNEILGNSWAVLPVTGYDGSGAYCEVETGRLVRNGEVVTVKSDATHVIQCVAKVTEKAQEGCVHISHSQGHQQGIYTVAADSVYTNTHREAFGTYLVDGDIGRDIDRDGNVPGDDDAVLVPPSAPGKGTHPNKIIKHHVSGAASGANYATDPIGGSQGWFDTKVRVE